MRRYAQQTNVPVDRSEAEIKKLLRNYGATDYLAGWVGSRVLVGFRAKDRNVRFVMNLPAKGDKRFTHTENRQRERSQDAADEAWELECRRYWRALCLVIKAKLEAVSTGIATFEDEFLAYTVLPGGKTVSEEIQPKIAKAIASGKMNVPLLQLPERGD